MNNKNEVAKIKEDFQTKSDTIDSTLNIEQKLWEEKISKTTSNPLEGLQHKLEQLIAINSEQSPSTKLNRLLIWSENFDEMGFLNELDQEGIDVWFENLNVLREFLREYQVELILEKRKIKNIKSYLG